jgi:hypothetical protein
MNSERIQASSGRTDWAAKLVFFFLQYKDCEIFTQYYLMFIDFQVFEINAAAVVFTFLEHDFF